MSLAVAADVAAPQQPALESGLDLSALDRSVRPQDDLFRHVNGGWLDAAEIPPERVSYGTFVELEDQAELELRAIIEEAPARPHRRNGSARQQIVDLYASLLDEALAERLGASPLRAELKRIDAIRTAREFAAEAGYLSAIAAGGPFGGSVGTDARDPRRLVVQVTQGGTLLPDRDYYVKDDPRFLEIRRQYETYLATIFTLADRSDARPSARAVLTLEIELARAQSTEAAGRDAPNRFSLAQLRKQMPGFDWQAWAKPQGIDRAPTIVLAQPSFFERFAALQETTPLETWKAWLAARYVTACAPFLSKAFADARFEFFGRVLSGQELPRTRWKRAVSLVSGYLGDALGRLYVERRFPSRAKALAEKLVANMIEAQRRAIRAVGWMSPATKREALDKLSRLTVRVGHPDQWRRYDGLVIKADDLLGNIQRAKQFENEVRMARLAQPAAHEEWPITPQTVNASYNPASNEIVLPAAILQPPLFDVDAEDAVNYGAIGAVIGHEIGHGFDPRGRRFDGRGAPRDWWQARDEQAFQKRARALVEQFGAMSPLDGLRVDGRLTLGENIGDLGGLEIAYQAYSISLAGRPAPVLDGFTGAQRFFMSWARTWRSKARDEYLRQWLLSIPHAPPKCRANGAVSNVAGFYEAFGVKPGDRLYREPDKRVTIW